ncbi:MAG: citrate synthase [Candidatus Hydrogenedentes bacterium]|nr:citrate synthase [Candidatus Hydrogenedentota bacterium]
MMSTAKLILDGKEYEFPVIEGTENERAIDIAKLRSDTGYITHDPSYGNTGSCKSSITYIDGERGILRYRGYPVEDLAGKVRYSTVAYLLIHGELPTREQAIEWRRLLTQNSLIHESMINFFDHFPVTAHPMNILASMISAMSSFYPYDAEDEQHVYRNVVRLIGQVKTIAAFAFRKSRGEPVVYPRMGYSYPANFLRMMFASPAEDYRVPKVLEEALRVLLIVHADHEQNCSTSTVRMVGSSLANIYAAVSSGINALWGRLHGGANQAVIEMLQKIQADEGGYKKYIEMAKDKNSTFRLMGFGHRVYKNFDPRAIILKKACDDVLNTLGISDPLLDVAKHLEDAALHDDFFIERKLYPNVDFYSGILYRAIGIPTDMFTVMFAMGRTPGWIAHWLEMRNDPETRIHRPRQIYVGLTERRYTQRRQID